MAMKTFHKVLRNLKTIPTFKSVDLVSIMSSNRKSANLCQCMCNWSDHCKVNGEGIKHRD